MNWCKSLAKKNKPMLIKLAAQGRQELKILARKLNGFLVLITLLKIGFLQSFQHGNTG